MEAKYRILTTYQDMLEDIGTERRDSAAAEFVHRTISIHTASRMYRTAATADTYDAQQNEFITRFCRWMFSPDGKRTEDITASNNRIASNFYNVLNTARNSYSLGNGVSFEDDKTKDALGGRRFDATMLDIGYNALKHGVSFAMWDLDRLYNFPLTEFVPLWDEHTGALMAGIRFWRISADRPMTAVLYEVDGYTVFRAETRDDATMRLHEPKRAYKQRISKAPADDNPEVIGEENYSALPIVPFWGSRLHQSTLIGLKEAIDSYDLVKSGFANDLQDCAQVFWIVENRGGMNAKDLAKFRETLLLNHIANANTQDGGKITPYTQDIPYTARKELLQQLRSGMYEDFSALDIRDISSRQVTATEINAAYQPVDNVAADFERQMEGGIMTLLSLLGIDDKPQFTRNRVSNQMEQVNMVLAEASYLDEETILRKLPNIDPDELEEIFKRREEEAEERMRRNPFIASNDGKEDGNGDDDKQQDDDVEGDGE